MKRKEISEQEKEILSFWKDKKVFEKSLRKEAPLGDFTFFDGPPFATGLPHYGHILASVIKDAIPRYKTMRGYRVPRIWGWDCHGLPIENLVEKELGFKSKKEIKEYGIEKFNERCREKVQEYVTEWEQIIPRIGRFVDMENSYKTMDKKFMESVWWVFKNIYDKGLVYEDYRVMHVCPRCETTLSQAEVAEGYKNVKDISVTVKFKLNNPEKVDLTGDVYILAWTTTPWTLPANTALAIGDDIEYVTFSKDSTTYIASKKFVERESFGKIGKKLKSKDLAGLKYTPPFNRYVEDVTLKNYENAWSIYTADFVSDESGTGVVHIAPAFGSDDWELSKDKKLPFIQHVGIDGKINDQITGFSGLFVKPRSDDDRERLGTDIAIIRYLQDRNLFFAKQNLIHSYPHCWRCDTPLLNFATSSLFISVEKLKDRLLLNAKNVNWSPEHIKEGRFGKWLDGARDWSISRQRFWASVIPLWKCNKCLEQRVFGSVSELEEASGEEINDLHSDIVDKIIIPCQCGSSMHRIPDVLDTWFDSGSMPYASRHYPFNQDSENDVVLPAQFIAEGIDQTRAWFYYLHIFGTALFDKNAFENVIVNGVVLAEDGKKMSKRLQNYPDPMYIIEKYGADAMRFYLLSSPVVSAENLSFAEDKVDEIAKKNIGRLQNVLDFYNLYKNQATINIESTNILDRWILVRLSSLVDEVTEAYEKYQLQGATRPISIFIDDLSTWYIRRSRDRFKNITNGEASEALSTTRKVLRTLALIMSPSTPFIAEEIFQDVHSDTDVESVHLMTWPENNQLNEPQLIEDMGQIRRLASEALMLRQHAGIPQRQPLASLSIQEIFSDDLIKILADEVNVKQVIQDANRFSLDTTLDQSLVQEGYERIIGRAVAEARKNEGFSFEDEVSVEYTEDGKYDVKIGEKTLRFNLTKKL